MGWGGGLFDYSVKPGQELSRLRLSLVRLVTRSIKAWFGQVGDQVAQLQGIVKKIWLNRICIQLDDKLTGSIE